MMLKWQFNLYPDRLIRDYIRYVKSYYVYLLRPSRWTRMCLKKIWCILLLFNIHPCVWVCLPAFYSSRGVLLISWWFYKCKYFFFYFFTFLFCHHYYLKWIVAEHAIWKQVETIYFCTHEQTRAFQLNKSNVIMKIVFHLFLKTIRLVQLINITNSCCSCVFSISWIWFISVLLLQFIEHICNSLVLVCQLFASKKNKEMLIASTKSKPLSFLGSSC